MKNRFIKLASYIAMCAMMACSATLVSCSDDDEATPIEQGGTNTGGNNNSGDNNTGGNNGGGSEEEVKTPSLKIVSGDVIKVGLEAQAPKNEGDEPDNTFAVEVEAENVEADVVFASSDESVFTVDADGIIKPLKLGTAKLTVTCGDLKQEATVEVHSMLKESCLWALNSWDVNNMEVIPQENGSVKLKVNSAWSGAGIWFNIPEFAAQGYKAAKISVSQLPAVGVKFCAQYADGTEVAFNFDKKEFIVNFEKPEQLTQVFFQATALGDIVIDGIELLKEHATKTIYGYDEENAIELAADEWNQINLDDILEAADDDDLFVIDYECADVDGYETWGAGKVELKYWKPSEEEEGKGENISLGVCSKISFPFAKGKVSQAKVTVKDLVENFFPEGEETATDVSSEDYEDYNLQIMINLWGFGGNAAPEFKGAKILPHLEGVDKVVFDEPIIVEPISK